MIGFMKHHFRLIQLLIISLFSVHVYAAHPLVFYVVDYPPYIIVKEGKVVTGVDVDVVKAAYSAVGQDVEFRVLPWKRILKLMEAGEIAGTVSCSVREPRKRYMWFSEPISQSRVAAASIKDRGIHGIRVLEDLKNYSVVAVGGWGIQSQLITQGIEHATTKDFRTGLISIIYRGMDVFYTHEIPTLNQALKMHVEDKITMTYIDDVPPIVLHLCVSQRYPASQSIVDKFNRGLALIKKSGTFGEIQSHYFRTAP